MRWKYKYLVDEWEEQTGKDNFSQEQTKKSHSIHLLEFRGGDDMLIMLIQES